MLLRTSDASPDRRTAVPYMHSILRHAAGFALWLFAKPECIRAKTAFLLAESLAVILGPLSSGLRTTPTWVACAQCTVAYRAAINL